MIANLTFVGLMAPVFTIFNPDFSVNTERIPAYADYLLESGIKGVLVAATNGEGASMSVYERKKLTEAWASAVKNTGQHLMVQVGGAPIPDVLELARHANALRVGSILTLPELYVKAKNHEELVTYLKFVSAAAPDTALYYYHNPGYTGVDLNMAAFFEQVAGHIPTFRGIKYTSNDLVAGYAALRAAKGRYTVFMGGDFLIEPAFAVGFNSAIAGAMNVFPRYYLGIMQAIKHSKIDIAMELQQNLTSVLNIISRYGDIVPATKLAMNLLTPINVGLARPPLQNPNSTAIQEMRYFLEPYL